MMKKHSFIPITVVLVSTFFLSIFGNTGHVFAHELSEDFNFDFEVSVYVNSIDFSEKTASIRIRILILNRTWSDVTEIWVIFEAEKQYFLKCTIFGEESYFGYEEVVWPLSGFGESYPFDSYKLRFLISRSFYFVEDNHIHYLTPNATLSRVYSPGGFNTVELEPWQEEFYIREFFISVKRTSLIPAYQLLLPIIMCCFLLGGSLVIDRSKLALRMRVYLSLFVFAPTFLFAIQSYLPYRLSLCIPEILLVGVLTSTAIFLFSSMIPLENTRTTAATIMDFAAVCVSVVLLLSLFLTILSLSVSFEILVVLILAILGLSVGLILHSFWHLHRRFRMHAKAG